MPRSTLLELERERHRERQLERWRGYRAQQVKSAAASAEEVPAQVDELYSHLPAEEKQEIARRAMARRPLPDIKTDRPPADSQEREDEVPKQAKPHRPRMTNAQKERARKLCVERRAADPSAVGSKVWKELEQAGIHMSEPVFYTKYWKPADPRAAKPDAGAVVQVSPNTNGSATRVATLECPDGRFRAEVHADGRCRVVMDMAVDARVANTITGLVIESWRSTQTDLTEP